MKYRAAMKEEELIKKLENVKLPDIKLESHRRRLKMALLHSGYSKNKQEENFLEKVRVQTVNALDIVSNGLFARRPAWKVALTGVVAVMVITVAWISIPQASALVKSSLFPDGSREISGTQLNVDDQKASDILMADPRIQELLAQGATIDKILPIEVTAETVNPDGTTGTIKETWAQAWLVLGSKDWGVQIDLVRGQIVSITPSSVK